MKPLVTQLTLLPLPVSSPIVATRTRVTGTVGRAFGIGMPSGEGRVGGASQRGDLSTCLPPIRLRTEPEPVSETPPSRRTPGCGSSP
jgi:hypothetical protein